MKNEIEVIETTQPFSEIWSKIDYFRGIHSCKQFLKERISRDFYGLDYNRLFKAKKCYDLDLDTSRIITSQDIGNKAYELSYDATQAKEYYEAASTTTELTQPVLLYYGMVSLGKMLVDSTFEFADGKEVHGLSRKKIKEVLIGNRGFFTRFHDTYNPDPSIYTHGLTFSMEELFSMVPDLRREYKEVYGKESRINPHVDTETKMSEHFILKKDDLKLAFPALTPHFLLMFLFSSLARYRPIEWRKLIEGKTSSEIYLIRKFLRVSKRRFPNLIINELFGKTFVFHPGARLM